jgi:hypothetical protein
MTRVIGVDPHFPTPPKQDMETGFLSKNDLPLARPYHQLARRYQPGFAQKARGLAIQLLLVGLLVKRDPLTRRF